MILFLTGNTFRDRVGCEDKSEMIPDNHLIDEMQKMFPDPCRALYFSDGPDDFEFNDFFANDTLDCDEYWVYHAGRDLKVWIITPEGNLDIRSLGASESAELCVYLKQGVTFAARHSGTGDTGTLISAITVPRFSEAGLHLMPKDVILRRCPAARAFYDD